MTCAFLPSLDFLLRTLTQNSNFHRTLFLSILISIIPLFVSAETGSLEYSEWKSIPIPDAGGTENKGIWSVDLSGAPNGAVITGVDIGVYVTHARTSDIDILVTTEIPNDWLDHYMWERSDGTYVDVSRSGKAITKWNGLYPNRTFYLVGADFVQGFEGELSFFEIKVHWKTVGNIQATLMNWEGVLAEESKTKFVIWPSGQEIVNENPGTYYDVDAKNYWVEGFQDGPHGYEYWGSEEIIVSSEQTTQVEILRHNPYAEEFWFEYDGTRLEPNDIIPPGSVVTPKVRILNSSNVSWLCNFEIGWRYGSSGSAIENKSSSDFYVSSNANPVITLPNFAFTSEGEIYAYIKTYSENDNNSEQLTDSWNWNKLCEVKDQTPTEAATILHFAPPIGTHERGTNVQTSVTIKNTGTELRSFWVGLNLRFHFSYQ